MRKTTNYQLNMPDGTDTVDIEILNANAAAIDAALKGLSDEKEAKLSGAAAKTTLADADALPLLDSAASSATKRITFANLITAMKAKLGTVYAALSHTHTRSQITDFPASMTPTAHTHGTGDVTGLSTALSAKAERKTATGTLSTTGWTGSAGNWSQAVTVSWMLAADVPKARLTGTTAAQMDAWDTLEPYVDSAAGQVTFYCKQTAKPSAAMSVGIEVIR